MRSKVRRLVVHSDLNWRHFFAIFAHKCNLEPCFCTMGYQKCFEWFRADFLKFRDRLLFVNVAKTLYCRSKTRVAATTPYCDMASTGDPKMTHGVLGTQINKKTTKLTVQKTVTFGTAAKCLLGSYKTFRGNLGCQATTAR